MKTNSLKKKKIYFIQSCYGADVNQLLPSLHGGLLEITLTVPLNQLCL